MEDGRLHAPAALRNRDSILAILREHLPRSGLILEVASGSGEHSIHFGQGLPDHVIQPSDLDQKARASINAWIRASGVANVRPAIALDASSEVWSRSWNANEVAAMICINMIHISPWAAAVGLVNGAARVLATGAPLFLYGPYKREGVHTSESNARFDADLRQQNPDWGVRDLEAMIELGEEAGFSTPLITQMPANNLTLVFKRV